MTRPDPDIRRLTAADLDHALGDLSRILIDSVADGAAISFMAPLSAEEATRFWLNDVKPAVAAGDRLIFGAFKAGGMLGTVQLVIAMPPNQTHRADISKMIVHPKGRRQGLGAALMTAALDAARAYGKTLVTLDTRTGDVSETLYRRVGFVQAGIIPGFARDPDGAALHATTYMYRTL